MNLQVPGIIGLIILVLDIVAIVHVFGSGESTGAKLLWVLGILIYPVIGLAVWFFAGPRRIRPVV